MAPKTRIININNFHFGRAKTPNIDPSRKIFKRFKKKIKHISDRNFQLKMVPLDAERFKLFKYMCYCPRRYFVASLDDREFVSRQRSRHLYINTVVRLWLSLTIIFFCIKCNKYIDINIDIVSAYP